MTILNIGSRRPTTIAAPPPDWKVSARCRAEDVDAEDFFTTGKTGQRRARAACVQCPVIAECLRQTRAFDDGTYRWGIGGGMDGLQRRALELEEWLGNRPNLEMARLLVSSPWLGRLTRLRSSCGSLDGMVRALRGDGLMVDAVTVRVAVWWSGGQAPRVAWRGDTRSMRAIVGGELLEDVLRLRSRGARYTDIAAWMGVPRDSGVRALKDVLAGLEAEEAS
ncbi:WhiB family transcriptional regulator [Streptomyces sp. ME02-6979.5a]|uniref:WhiB family transcriptional regulator n=1 Tax=Streptomyces sp. ME02-6979.5a TaxID=462925 RepID=UPI0029BBF959|nr:WhiB family transcriptional regulator [Streptomyces sp. ME02-6979.5a]MDX3343452.1 WhiB family transcriptional regulator [Streptomyces sp. ME02-6979.5a]